MNSSLLKLSLLLFLVAHVYSSSIKFVVIGDWGREGGYNQTAVADSMGEYCRTHGPCDFVVSTGDNIYNNGAKVATDKKFQTSFEDVYTHESLQDKRWYMVLGNHDYRGNPDAQIQYTKLSKRWYMPSKYYSETFELTSANKNRVIKSTSTGLLHKAQDPDVRIKFVFADSNPLITRYLLDHSMNKTALFKFKKDEQAKFVKQELSNVDDRDWKFVVQHHSLYSAGVHGDHVPVKKAFSELFKLNKVHISFAGHDHDYQRLVNPKHPTTFVLSGAGSKIEYNRKQHPYLKNMQTVPGFNFVEVFKHYLVIRYIDMYGNKLDEAKISRFTFHA